MPQAWLQLISPFLDFVLVKQTLSAQLHIDESIEIKLGHVWRP